MTALNAYIRANADVRRRTGFLPLLMDPTPLSGHPPDQVEEDDLLLDAVRIGDVAALGKLYDRYAPQVYGLCVHLTESPGDADALLIAAFQRFWTAGPNWRPMFGGTLACLYRFAFLSRSAGLFPA